MRRERVVLGDLLEGGVKKRERKRRWTRGMYGFCILKTGNTIERKGKKERACKRYKKKGGINTSVTKTVDKDKSLDLTRNS